MASIACDSSSLIALAETCNLPILNFLSEKTNSSFVIPPFVKDEIISRPLQAKQHALSAFRLRKLVEDGILNVVSSPSIMRDTNEVLSIGNSLYSVGGKKLKILHAGEAQTLALFNSAKIDALLVDEKTLRLLVESPQVLASKLEHEYGTQVAIDERQASKLKKFTRNVFVMRSTEIAAAAFKKGFFTPFGEDVEIHVLEAALYALKKAGCSIAATELAEYSALA